MHIYVIFTGGTIGSSVSNTIISPDDSSRYKLISNFNKNYGGVEFTPVVPYTMLSENLTGGRLNQLINCVRACVDKNPDGIIVTHGTDTLQYTCAALGYVFSKAGVPIGIVSANYPLDDERTNGHENFAAAVIAIKGGVSGVFAAYKNSGQSPEIHCATRLLRHIEYQDAVYSLGGAMGNIQNGAYLPNPDFVASNDAIDDFCPDELDKIRVIMLNMYPNIDLTCDINGADAVLITSYHSGTLATDTTPLKNFCAKAAENSVPVFLTGAYQGDKYESAKAFDDLGIKVLPKMSAVAAYVKLWLACSSSISGDRLDKAMRASLCGDIV